MSELQSQFVRRGFWVNEARGSVMGQVITTDARTGTIIVALLALLTSLGMSHLWNLLTFAWHQSRANGRERDALFRQQQVLLRTLPSPSALVADSMKLGFAWRRTMKKSWQRSSVPALIALLYTFTTMATSVLSSYVAVSSDVEVLVNSPHCAMLNATLSQENYIQTLEPAVNAYASDCYQNGSLPNICNIFSRPSVAFSTKTTSCPFKDNICSGMAVEMDSGFLDVAESFGLNIAKGDNVQYRKRSVCSMLSLEGRESIINGSEVDPRLVGRMALPGETYAVYEFGGPNGTGYMFGISLYGKLFSKSIVHG